MRFMAVLNCQTAVVVCVYAVSSSLANGSSVTSTHRAGSSSHSQTSRSTRDAELIDSDRWRHDSPLARDEVARQRSAY